MAGHDHLICIVSDFAGAGERTLQLMRQLAAHNDVIAMQVYDPLALNLPKNGRLLITQGQLQVELAVEQRSVHQPLGDFLSGRLKDVATLLRRSQVPLMMFSTATDAQEQLRAELGNWEVGDEPEHSEHRSTQGNRPAGAGQLCAADVGLVGVAWLAGDRCFAGQRTAVLAMAAGSVSARGVGAVG